MYIGSSFPEGKKKIYYYISPHGFREIMSLFVMDLKK
jgi:hypothetical protein